jgi:beta-lactamase regulating signal transducer with metallopeptidase domain
MMDVQAISGALLDAALRGTVVLAAAFAATALMRRSSASARHLVWLAALVALLLLPLAQQLVPEWRVLPTAPAALAPLPAAAVHAGPAAAPEPAVVPDRSSAAAGTHPQAATAVRDARLPVDGPGAALLLWVSVSALLLLRLGWGVLHLHGIQRRAAELTDEEWVRLTDGLSRRLGLGRIVRLLRHPRARVPMTWGLFAPVVLLPAEADGWDADRRRVVLAHELAHVRRWDALTQWAAHLALALYWFNPLVWVAVRKLRQEREHACDDAVLEIGTVPAAYAEHLLTIVRSLGRAPAPAAALAMARRSHFEGRLLAILDGAVRRGGVSRAAGLATAAAALACLLPLAALRPAEAAPAPLPADATDSVEHFAAPTPRPLPDANDPALVEAAPPVPRAGSPSAPSYAPPAAPVDTGAVLAVIRAAEEIRSSTDRRHVLTRVLEQPDLTRRHVEAVLAATRTMDSDTDRRLVATRAFEHPAFRSRSDVPLVLLEVLRGMGPTDQRIVLSRLWEVRQWDDSCLETFFRATSRIEDDTDRRLVLTTAAARQRLRGRAREAYLAAARTITNETDRRYALSAVLADPPVAAEGTEDLSAGRRPGETKWDTDLVLNGTREGRPRTLRLRARDMFYRSARSTPHRIGPGGELRLEERWDGSTRLLHALPGADGQPVYTYSVDGAARAFDAAARDWMASVIRELTGN